MPPCPLIGSKPGRYAGSRTANLADDIAAAKIAVVAGLANATLKS
jgi:hypothetical protein